jgi:hypothetical protein
MIRPLPAPDRKNVTRNLPADSATPGTGADVTSLAAGAELDEANNSRSAATAIP